MRHPLYLRDRAALSDGGSDGHLVPLVVVAVFCGLLQVTRSGGGAPASAGSSPPGANGLPAGPGCSRGLVGGSTGSAERRAPRPQRSSWSRSQRFRLDAQPNATQRAVGAHHAVAGHDQRDGVARAGRSGRPSVAAVAAQLGVAPHLTGRDPPHIAPEPLHRRAPRGPHRQQVDGGDVRPGEVDAEGA